MNSREKTMPAHRFQKGQYLVHRHSSPECLGDPVLELTRAADGSPTYTLRDAPTGLDIYDVADGDLGEPGTINRDVI